MVNYPVHARDTAKLLGLVLTSVNKRLETMEMLTCKCPSQRKCFEESPCSFVSSKRSWRGAHMQMHLCCEGNVWGEPKAKR